MLLAIPLSIVALAYMLFVVIYTVVRYLRAGKDAKYTQLKNFKKGNFGLIYLGAIPLYIAGNLFNGMNAFRGVFQSFSQALSLVALSFKWDAVQPLMEESFFYKLSVYLCFGAAICNTMIFTVSVFWRRGKNRLMLKKFKKGDRALCIFVGYNERTRDLIRSVDREKYDVLLLCDESEETKKEAFVRDFAVRPFSGTEPLVPIVEGYCSSTDSRVVRMIINTENEERNFLLATAVGEYTKQLKIDNFSIDGHCGLSVFVFGSEKNESSYARLSRETRGCVQCVDPHRVIALDFVEKHPITSWLREEDIDPVTRTVKDEVSFNFVLIGFGRTSRQLLRIHAVNSQLITMRAGKPAPKTVAYHVFDIAKAENDVNLNHNFLRYSRWYKEAPRDEIYPVPQTVFDIGYSHMDVGDISFYPTLREKLTVGGNRFCNNIVVSFGSDLANIDLAEKLYEKLREWGLDKCTHIYVRVRNQELNRKVVKANFPEGEIVAFGLECETVSSFPYIVGESMETMARRQHLNYTKSDNPRMSEREAYDSAMKKWYDVWGPVQRDSNVYACLSIRMKLQLLGFDVAPLGDPRPDASTEFREAYFEGVDPAEHFARFYTEEELSDYTVRRHLITRMEHARWNAYMISAGFVPALESEYLNTDKQELYAMRKHANIVTFEGLYRYRRVMAQQKGIAEADADVIKYDYRLTDELCDLLAQSKQKIVRKG